MKLAGILAGAHFAMSWSALGLLKISGFELFTVASLFGLGPEPKHTPWQVFLWNSYTILGLPLGLLSGGGNVPWVVCSILNSVLWGSCLALLVYALRYFIPGKQPEKPRQAF
jgi:hypothetical protein